MFTKFIDPDKIIEFRKVIIEQNKIYIPVDEIKRFFGDSFENISVFFNEWTEKEDSLNMLEYLINYFRNSLVITKDSIESEILYAFLILNFKLLIKTSNNRKFFLKLKLKQFI